ncbi:MAG TPA: UDP-glucose 4-epimerase GalE [Patescibacteria group bacterium]|jgi:UDP-glucose 4-epimerase|nr:UDP-glucose 4-epimerase GalE [bacterium]HRT11086.1 UDP-glucose 4-epimerase GalE [Patescibacteria group bacterium]HRU89957.1 UDP-glucose 4-epimerase GalE [Patescibacteria group bacterium]
MVQPTLLITGGAGYIGSHAVKLFLDKGYTVVVMDNLSRGWQEPLDILASRGKLIFVRGDLTASSDLATLFEHYHFAGVLHFAALCLVDESMSKPELYFDNNVIGSFNLLEALRRYGPVPLIFSSTCAVYGESQYLPVDEAHPLNPANPYGESKLMVEKMIKWYGERYRIPYVILRYFNVSGADADGLIGDSKKPSELLMQNAVRGALNIEPFTYTCGKVATPDGTPIRDYINVEDLIEAHALAYDYLKNGGVSEIFNLGTGQGYSVKEIVQAVEHYFGCTLKKKQGVVRQGEYAQIYADITKAKEVLGWRPRRSLEDSIVSLAKWYSRYPQGYNF